MGIPNHELIALIDLDGTLCDYDTALLQSMRNLQSPEEEPLKAIPRGDKIPSYLGARMNLIRASKEWWVKIPKLKIGFEVLALAQRLEFHCVILTQGPKRNAEAWAGKKMWIDEHLGRDFDIIITRDKSLVYGKILVDDYPPYIEKWLKWRPRGLVIMPASASNESFEHPQVIRYSGKVNEWAQVSMAIHTIAGYPLQPDE